MKQRPILMSGPLVRAILDGKKTQTRRPMKELNDNHDNWRLTTDLMITYDGCEFPHFEFERKDNGHIISVPTKYGIPGDQLWVRETWKWEGETPWTDIDPVGMFLYRADPDSEDIRNWKPSIFMPKEACRIFLEIQDIRVERLQDISEEDAKAEGVKAFKPNVEGLIPSYRVGFFNKWMEIYGKDTDPNPYVWVIDFKVIPKQTK